ncbi:hypothetical protein VBJ55_22495 [Enterobacter hormaechei]|uniref:Uncharacterized protein n=1 Tax=Salmonella phage S144 TaxID=2759179 RepID=A0A7G5CF34_9CAUD|nr:hypothetical protein [Enterobacter hormaechei]QMV47870.1 hypothetical protein [Salmonella phage S144]UOK16634.1 hypothetical protein HBKIJOIA_00033 [Salmonella phage S1]HBU2310269.1 hypothetical protein [Klebsiella pneumoniae]
MNLQRVAESYYHIWILRLQGQIDFVNNTGREDYLPADAFAKVCQYAKDIEYEFDKVKFTAGVQRAFTAFETTMRCKFPYIKRISRTGLFIVPFPVGKDRYDVVERARHIIWSTETKRKFIETVCKELRDAIQ